MLLDTAGSDALRLIMPALARLSRQGKWIAMIASPYIPCPSTLVAHGIDPVHLLLIHPGNRTDLLALVERALRAGTCGALLVWTRNIDDETLRRLQCAAAAGKTWGVLLRLADAEATAPASPTALRLQLAAHEDKALVKVLQCGNSTTQTELVLDLNPRQVTTPAAQTLRFPSPLPGRSRRTPRSSVVMARPRSLPPLVARTAQFQMNLPLAIPSASPESRPQYKEKPEVST
jgi:cell division inhibitor SulA